MSTPQPGDKSAAFTGLILGAITIFVIIFSIVRITNAQYAGHGEGAEPAAAPAAAAPPAPSPAPTGH
jgi:hypothetical protein